MFRRFALIPPRLAGFVRFNSTEPYNAALGGLKKDLKKAMLAKDELKKTTIRSLLSTIKNKEIDNRDKIFDEFTLFDLYSKLISQRRDSITEFLNNKREDLVDKEQHEIEIIEQYMKELPVSSKEEVNLRVLQLLRDLKEKDPNLQMKQIFGKINWKTVNSEWKASANAVRASIVQQFKNVF
ncbi:altered inheritance of mitochondria protein 41 mitochondrial [Zygosaccharomyces mellis]|uniref:Altered inheritance of mitochondria protein 41 n=1 Tax=Zygosaccharomyces mellis TaxID=42258 RepID=A0A4C2EED4_9SACH|nr:altered inheritance of mitochondria protein 41 mitochondrial [Zygosaccharomyces mellis]